MCIASCSVVWVLFAFQHCLPFTTSPPLAKLLVLLTVSSPPSRVREQLSAHHSQLWSLTELRAASGLGMNTLTRQCCRLAEAALVVPIYKRGTISFIDPVSPQYPYTASSLIHATGHRAFTAYLSLVIIKAWLYWPTAPSPETSLPRPTRPPATRALLH